MINKQYEGNGRRVVILGTVQMGQVGSVFGWVKRIKSKGQRGQEIGFHFLRIEPYKDILNHYFIRVAWISKTISIFQYGSSREVLTQISVLRWRSAGPFEVMLRSDRGNCGWKL